MAWAGAFYRVVALDASPNCASWGNLIAIHIRLGVISPRPLTRTEAIGRREHHERTRHDRPDPRSGSGLGNPMTFTTVVLSTASS